MILQLPCPFTAAKVNHVVTFIYEKRKKKSASRAKTQIWVEFRVSFFIGCDRLRAGCRFIEQTTELHA